jgi:hypothetical protein
MTFQHEKTARGNGSFFASTRPGLPPISWRSRRARFAQDAIYEPFAECFGRPKISAYKNSGIDDAVSFACK